MFCTDLFAKETWAYCRLKTDYVLFSAATSSRMAADLMDSGIDKAQR